MSATICYIPRSRIKSMNNVAAPSSFIEKIEKLFGRFPLTLSEEHIGDLIVANRVLSDPGISELIEVIEKCGEIELRAEY